MSKIRVCDFCGIKLPERSENRFIDNRPRGINGRGVPESTTRNIEHRIPSQDNSYCMSIYFTLLPERSIELDVCEDCMLMRVKSFYRDN